MSEHPRFIADVMVGSLAKWLRMLGFDTLYFRHISDNDLVRVALQEGRIILTRDRALARRRGAGRTILIESQVLREQLLQVLSDHRSLPGMKAGEDRPLQGRLPGHPRCPRCNGALAGEKRSGVSDDVPPHILRSHHSFFRCRHCGKVYWEGSHKMLIDKTIRSLLRQLPAPGDTA